MNDELLLALVGLVFLPTLFAFAGFPRWLAFGIGAVLGARLNGHALLVAGAVSLLLALLVKLFDGRYVWRLEIPHAGGVRDVTRMKK